MKLENQNHPYASLNKIIALSAVLLTALSLPMSLFAEPSASAISLEKIVSTPLPAGAAGFGGVIQGTVKAIQPDGMRFGLAISEVEVNDLNKAVKPAALVGRCVAIAPRWVKVADGKWFPAQEDVQFITHLLVGQEISVTAVNWNTNSAVLDLNWYEGAKAGDELTPVLPAVKKAEAAGTGLLSGAVGFGGVITGTVKEVKPDGMSFGFAIASVEANSLNKAAKPASLTGQKVTIGPRWIKNAEGRFVPAQEDLDFIKGLLVGQEMTVTAVNWNTNAAGLDLNWYEGSPVQLTPAKGF